MYKNDSVATNKRMTLGLLPAGGEYIVTITNNFTSIQINSKSFRNASIGARRRRCVMQKPGTKSRGTFSLIIMASALYALYKVCISPWLCLH